MLIREARNNLCPCCMEEHKVKTVVMQDTAVFKGERVEYTAEYMYCDKADDFYAFEEQINGNDINMKNAYRERKGLLTSQQITVLRESYRISRSDLSLLLGWEENTIARYESHQVQDVAHDTILRKLADDPAWFLKLLSEKRDALPEAVYNRCAQAGAAMLQAKRASATL